MSKKRKGKKNAPPTRDLKPFFGLLLCAFALSLFFSLLSFAMARQNWLGLLGSNVGWFGHALLGQGSYFFALFTGWYGWRLCFNKPIHHPVLKGIFMSLFILSFCLLLNLMEFRFPAVGSFFRDLFYPALKSTRERYHLGGAPLFYLYKDLPGLNLHKAINSLGIALMFSSTLLASILFLAKISPTQLWNHFAAWYARYREKSQTQNISTDNQDPSRMVKLRIPTQHSTQQQELMEIQPDANPKVRPSLSRKEFKEIPEPVEEKIEPAKEEPVKPPSPARKREAAIAAQRVHNGDFSGYKLPSPALLTSPKKVDQHSLKKDLRRQAEVLEETLMSFGIEAKVGQINCGPTITSFEVHPAIGVKVQKIKTLEDDIALNMEAKAIRIIAPIPGKAAVGIEVPNGNPQEVSFKEILQAYTQGQRKFHVPILLGKAVNGDYVMSDLTKMPHCIIAGATGSGKSVCINTIIMSILLNARPDEIKMIMVDPKKVELTPYSRLPHMLAPVITEPQGARAALNWMVKEMENRYELLKLMGVRNIDGFNTRTINKEQEAALEREIPEKLPYIVGIIDELADLMMVASSDFETPIARIAQMARAVGIHLILATQRPSREVITGLIKANFPTRISFKVASRVNSQIVLDEIGAEALLGNGDMLFLPPGTSHLTRAQGAYIRDEDINAVIKAICDQAPPRYVIESFDRMRLDDDDGSSDDDEPQDSLYQDALDIVLSTGNASTTFLQRKLKIGYARAASLIDQLESRGIVGPAEGSKPRKILAKRNAASVPEPEAELAPIDEVEPM
ncbi:MAG: DNA translocase FtsK [Parachlamydia sp.]|nr:DNA translocase FtsK [Parachlamydia sp.]